MLLLTSTRRLCPLGSGSVVAMRPGTRPSSSSAAGGGKTKLVIVGTGWGGFRVGKSLGHCWFVMNLHGVLSVSRFHPVNFIIAAVLLFVNWL